MTDKEILDWMEENLMSLHMLTAPDMGGIRFVGQTRNIDRDKRRGGMFRINHRSIRAAIEEAANPKEISGSIPS